MKKIHSLVLATTVVIAVAGVAFVSIGGALQDADGDLVPDGFDNCLNFANGPAGPSDQVDTDCDGYGNACDCDVDASGLCGIGDFSAFASAYGTTSGSPGYDARVDFDGSDSIGIGDFARFAAMYGGPPGPSGLACANLNGTPCCQQ